MTTGPRLPLTGYSLEKVYFSEQRLRLVQADDLPAKDDPQISFAWDWRIREPLVFEIILQIGLDPTRARPEEVRVTACGVFRILGRATTVGVKQFVGLQGPAILMPYVREAISALTGRGFFGQVLLPPINVQTLMVNQDAMAATGEKQLASPEGVKLLPA